MNKSVFSRRNFNKCSEGHKSYNLAFIYFSNLRAVSNCLYYGKSLIAIFKVNSGNEHISVFIYINFHIAFRSYLLNNFAALTNNFSYFFNIDFGLNHFRRIFIKVALDSGIALSIISSRI